METNTSQDEKPDFDEIEESSSEGEVETRTVQEPGRVNIPNGFLQEMGLNYHDKIVIVCKNGWVKLMNPSDLIDDGEGE